MVNLIKAVATLIERHGEAVSGFAIHEANGQVLKLSVQLARLRTVDEQRALLQKHYLEILAVLEQLDNDPFGLIFHMIDLLPSATITLDDVEEVFQRYAQDYKRSDALNELDVSDFFITELSQLPKDGLAFDALETYKAFAMNEHFLEKVSESLDWLEREAGEKKLSADQLQQRTDPDELKEMLGTMIQQAVQPLYEKERLSEKAYLNMDEAAAYLNMAKQTLYGLTSTRAIPFIKRAKHNLFQRADLDEWLAAGKKKSIDQIRKEASQPNANGSTRANRKR